MQGNTFFSLALLVCLVSILQAQSHSNSIRGTIIDKDSKMPLFGATIAILSTDPIKGNTSDLDGDFKIEDIPVGRHDIQVTYLGYESAKLNSIMVTSGKELILNIELQETTTEMDEIVVSAESQRDKAAALNEMALSSVRSFSVEEAGRYAGAFYDPARMAQNYAGVSTGGGSGDLYNEIVVRGNSPSGVLWKLEGIEIPNPNHFGNTGGTGGAVSMLSSSTLASSDFYTGAFPAEFGNATSGVFDLKLRNGNNDQHEFTFMVGVLGLEAAIEGPFSKKSKASFLINYRYSTLGLLKALKLSPVGDILPTYQDLSFKINLPAGKAGTFSLWGLGGINNASFQPKPDSSTWNIIEDDAWGFSEKNKVGTVGLSHKIAFSDKGYLKTTVALSNERYDYEDYWLNYTKDYEKNVYEVDLFNNIALRATTSYTHKFNAKHTLRSGAIFSHLAFNFDMKAKDDFLADNSEENYITYLKNKGSTQLLQGFTSWKYRPHKNLTFNTGLHYTHFTLNDNFSIEPRFAMKWLVHPKHTLSGAAGLHSKTEHISFYLVEDLASDGTRRIPNKNLELVKSFHSVLGYDWNISNDFRLKLEAYYQHLFDVPVENVPGSTGSIINVTNLWEVIERGEAVNRGKARNYGLDLTFEKFFSKQYYFLLTGSLFNSKFTPMDGKEYNTRFSSNYQFNLLAGKEFKVGKRKNNIIGLNGKFLLAGGNRYTPIDLEASQLAGETILLQGLDFSAQIDPYYRFDLGFSYKINMKRATHSFSVDVQNVTNHLNVHSFYYDNSTNDLKKYYQTGIFPVLSYRVQW